jgi:hypothetical protein
MVPPEERPARRRGRVADAVATGVGRWRVPAWALASAAAAPLLLIVGFVVAADLQPASFDPVRESISALAGETATHPGVMTSTLVGVGLAHISTAIGLFGAGLLSRLLLAVSGTGTALVAAFPLPSGGRTSWAHAMFAIIAFLTLAIWPMALVSRFWGPAEEIRPFPARPPTAITASIVLGGILCWFGFEQLLGGPAVGLSERIAGVAESTWPLVVAAAARVAQQKAVPARQEASVRHRDDSGH